MSIADKLLRYAAARADIIDALDEKSVDATGHGFEDFADDIRSIQSGGGGVIVTDTTDSHGGTIREITSVNVVSLQRKTIDITPSESSQSQTVTPDGGKTGLSQVTVNTSAISSSYVGSGVTRRSSSDLTASGATITAPAGYYESAASKAVASGTEGTPSAAKSVSGTTATITPTVTNTAGYITGGTKNGTAVTVTASELDTLGTKSITENGTGIDVTGYSAVNVNVGGASKNVQIAVGTASVRNTSYTEVSGQSITVAKTGTYDVYWVGFRSSTSGTNGSQLYINNSAYGSAQTTFSSYGQNVHLSNVSLTAGAEVAVRARARGTSYYMYVGNLTIVEA